MTLKRELTILKFKRIGKLKIQIKTNEILFKKEAKNIKVESGNVYVFVTEKEKKACKIIYIGMTEKTILERLKEHVNGYKNTPRGIPVGEILKKKIPKQYTIAVYCRKSDKETILDIKGISLCAVEEKALIKRFKENHCLINGRKLNNYSYTSI
ncbi:GIY-YIG nuclease family protein [Ferruginibacter sp.]